MITFPGARIATIALLACAVIFVLVSCRDPGYARIRVEHGTTFVVEAAPFSLIDLRVNGRRAASAYVPWNGGEVRFEGTPLDSGRNVVEAQTTLWYAASRKAHTAVVQLENAHHPRAPRAPPVVHSQNGRSLALAVRQQAVAADIAVALPWNDRAIVAIRSGRIDLVAFVDDVFGTPRFHRKLIASFFTGIRPRFYIGGGTVTVSAASGYQHLDLEDLPAFQGDIDIGSAFTGPRIRAAGTREADRSTDTRQWAYDVLRLRVRDYRVVDRAPLPAVSEDSSYTWERPFQDGRTHVVVSLAFAPFASVDALRSALNLPIFAFTPHVVARFLAFSHGFILAIPMFAYLVLSRGRNARLATVARRLIVVAVAADVFDACISAQPDVDGEIMLLVPCLRSLPPALISLFVVPALIGVVLAVLAWSVAHLAARSRSTVATLLADGANAVCAASLGFAVLVAAGFAAHNAVRLPFVYPVLIGAVLAATLVGVLIAIDWWVIPDHRNRHAFTVATLACAAALALPLSLVQFGMWATVPEHAGTAFADPLAPLPLTASFLRSLAPLCPLAFGLLLIAAVRPDTEALELGRADFLRLLLCSYAVLAGVVVLVPVGFVLAWMTFPLLRVRAADATFASVGSASISLRTRGFAVIPIALVFVAIEVLVLLPSEVQHLHQLHTPFIVLEAAGFLGVIVAALVLPAFALATCKNELAGDSGLRVGASVGLWTILCSTPAWFLRSDNAGTAVAIIVVTGLFYATLGYVIRTPRAYKLARLRVAAASRRAIDAAGRVARFS